MEVFVTKTYQKVGLFLMAVPRLFWERIFGRLSMVCRSIVSSQCLPFFEAIPSPITSS